MTKDRWAPSSAQDDFAERAHRVIPGGAHTYSRGDDQQPFLAPRGFVRAKGARAWDLDGREYVDWGMGINNVLIGHAEDEIDEAAIQAIRGGQAFSRPSPGEVGLAESLVELMPGLDMAKLGKNGSDANTAAVRLARAITGRDRIAYDGSAPFLAIHDWFIGKTVVNAGVPKAIQDLTVPFIYNDVASVNRLFDENRNQLAAVILEVCRETRPAPGFLETLRRRCDEQGTLLIFDEIVTGFRYSLSGAYSLYGVTPDLASFGKGMANGYALSALLGRREFMERGGLRHAERRVFLLSTTNGPEQSAIAAARAAIDFYKRNDVIARIEQNGRRFMEGLNEAARRHQVQDYLSASSDFGARPVPLFLGPDRQPSTGHRTLFLQEMLQKQVFMPWVCPSFRHGESEMDQTLEAFDHACRVYARAIESRTLDGLLSGSPTKPVFREYN